MNSLRMNKKFIGACLFVAIASVAVAQERIQLSAFPQRTVADGRSTATITATVKDSGGRAVPDGTRVLFQSTLGSFRESVVLTRGGLANATLVAGGVAGFDRIKVTLLSGSAAPSLIDFEYVVDRAMLSASNEYIEITAPVTMQYTADSRIIAASGTDKPVVVRFRDIKLEAEEVQIDVSGFVIKARRAHLKMGKIDQNFNELVLRLNGRTGIGTTTFIQPAAPPIAFATDGRTMRPFTLAPNQTLQPSGERERFGVVELSANEFAPANTPLNTEEFNFEDISTSPSTIRAKKAVVSRRRGIQFQKAAMYVGETRVLSMPLYELSNIYSDSPVVTDALVQVRDNRLNVNYPYYTNISPGQTSLFRLRTGESYGRSTSATPGILLDYEMNWNKGDDMEGGALISGIGRDDWNASFRQFLQINQNTRTNFQLLSPQGKSIFGSVNVFNQQPGYQISFNGNLNRNLRGLTYDTQDLSLSVEKEPIKVGKLPARLTYGINTTYSRQTLDTQRGTQRNTGIYTRLSSNPLRLDPNSSLTLSTTITQNSGTSSQKGIGVVANASLFRRFSPSSQATLNYDFRQNSLDDAVLGHHYFSLDTGYFAGRTAVSVLVGKSLDADRFNLFGDLSYRLSPAWRLGYSYTFDKYLSNTYFDTNYVIGYRVGWREVGLTYSQLTRRFGLQILGTTVY